MFEIYFLNFIYNRIIFLFSRYIFLNIVNFFFVVFKVSFKE